MKFIDLFSGIGGFSLGLEQAGMTCVGHVENDPYCRTILKKHWPNVPLWGDIRTAAPDRGWVDRFVSLYYSSCTMAQKGEFDPKYDQAASLYERGLSIQDVADFYNVTRQSMWVMLKRRSVQMRKKAPIGDDNHFHRGGSKKSCRCTRAVGRAIKKGLLTRSPCEICGGFPTEAHHDDYNKPLDVRWLCKVHHYEWHKFNKAIGEEEGSGGPEGGVIDLVCAGPP